MSKGPKFEESGSLNVCSRNGDDWKGFIEACKKQTRAELIDGAFSKMYAQYPRFAHEVHNTFAVQEVMDGELQNEWIWGEAGSGKTSSVWKKYGNDGVYIKSLNKWWDGYEDREVVLIDDWDPRTSEKLTSHLKAWADRYPFRAEIKGGSVVIRPKKLVVTSNYSIDQCFNGPDVEAIKRRFKVIHMSSTVDYE